MAQGPEGKEIDVGFAVALCVLVGRTFHRNLRVHPELLPKDEHEVSRDLSTVSGILLNQSQFRFQGYWPLIEALDTLGLVQGNRATREVEVTDAGHTFIDGLVELSARIAPLMEENAEELRERAVELQRRSY